LPLAWWLGLMRDLARGSLWPVLVSRFALQSASILASATPGVPLHGL
jgi:hypothetical protein